MLGAILVWSCSKDTAPPATQSETPSEGAESAHQAAPEQSIPEQAKPVTEPAQVDKPAPNFTLSDLEGNKVSLSDFSGKTVVLEWFNPECPFVKKAHTVGSLVGMAQKHRGSGVVWLAINSGAPGKQGHGLEKNQEGASGFGMKHPVLLDETGAVGRLYGAERTPHMFVIDGDGTLVYEGAIDNSPDAEKQSPEGGKLVNYVDVALAALSAGRDLSVQQTDPYGCSVKYGD